MLYWTDWQTKNIHSANLLFDDVKPKNLLKGIEELMGIKVGLIIIYFLIENLVFSFFLLEYTCISHANAVFDRRFSCWQFQNMSPSVDTCVAALSFYLKLMNWFRYQNRFRTSTMPPVNRYS